MDYVYRFPVVRGLQAGREYFIGMVPLKMISRLFPNDEEYVPPEYRAQRKLNTSRIPEISKYILQNRHDYVFSALAASIDGKFKFISADLTSDIGVLEVSMDARFQINDGQHRKAAIIEALVEDETLGDETISVVFFEDKGLTRSQQIFTDLNKHAVKTSNSISELYDSRDDLAVVTRKVVSSVKFINTFTDKEKDNLGKFSSNLFALNMFYKANKKIIQRMDVDTECEKFLLRGSTPHFFKGLLCPACNYRGFYQRIGIYYVNGLFSVLRRKSLNGKPYKLQRSCTVFSSGISDYPRNIVSQIQVPYCFH